MKKLILLFSALICHHAVKAQCTTTNATSCQCENSQQTNCDLLPDITISWAALESYSSGPTEYAQTGNGVNNGRLKVSGATPNIGHGPLNVFGQWDSAGTTWSYFLCYDDTVLAPISNFTCSNGDPIPMQMPKQRIYHKNGNTMSAWTRFMGPVTYHGGGSLYNDDWGIFTLRIKNPAIIDPREWSIVGVGHKLGFCLMDYNECSDFTNHCKDDNTVYNAGNNLQNNDFPNWGLGGGNYGCSAYGQGISSGYEDIYSESLDGMWINIPPGTCNGDYWIVYEVDPHNYFLEEDETNNYTAIPFTLTQQTPSGNPAIKITPENNNFICSGSNTLVKLTATAGLSYLWSPGGATTQSILAGPGTYSVSVTNYCGTGSASYTVIESSTPEAPTGTDDTVCSGTSANLSATGTNITWFDGDGAEVGTGNNFTTPILTSTTQYFAKDQIIYPETNRYGGKPNNNGGGGNNNSNSYLMFDVFRPITIKSVKVYASGAGERTITIWDEIGIIQQGGTFNIPDGESRVELNFTLQPGKNYSIRTSANPNLYRNNAGVTYPYLMPDTLSITGTNQGAQYYYFFYDWELKFGGATCTSPQTAVTAIVEECTGIDDNWDLSNNISVFPNPSNGKFSLDIIMPGTADANVMVRDLTGREIFSNQLVNISGKHNSVINLENVRPGVYMLDVKIGRKNYFKKLVVQ